MKRVAFALAVGLSAAAYCWFDASHWRPGHPNAHRDFDQVWFAARALWRGENPYALIGPHGMFRWPWPFFYPLTAAIAVMPIAWLPMLVGRIIFAAVSLGAFAYVITRESWAKAPAVISWCALVAAFTGQWSPLLIAASSVPWLSGLLAAKPNLGVVLMLGQPRRHRMGAVIGAAALIGLSFVFMPGWVVAWRAAISEFGGVSLIATPFGLILITSLIRWRRRETWLLLLMATIPHTISPYEELPLFLIPSTPRESFVLAVGSYLAGITQGIAIGSPGVYNGPLASAGYVAFLYLPALVMILRRPNRSQETECRPGSLPISSSWPDFSRSATSC